MGLLHVSTYFCLYLFKTQLRVRKDEFPQLFGDQNHFRTGGETVQTADTASGMRLFIAFLCLNGRVMAAGEGSGYGDGKHVFRISESLQPFMDVWAGCAGAAFVGGKVCEHFVQIQVRIICKFLLIRNDF